MTTTPVQPAPEPVAHQPAPAPTRVCSHCGSDNIRESSTRRGTDLLLANIGKTPYRCRSCRARFYLKGESDTPDTPGSSPRKRKPSRKREPIWKHPTIRRHMNEISIGVGSVIAFAIFLYLLARSGISL